MTVRHYIRASLRKQEASPDVQRELLLEHCKLKGWPNPVEYVDKATTSRIPLVERAAGSELCNALDRGDKIVITKLDRAFRSLKEFLSMMEQWNRIGVEVHILNFMGGHAVDFSSPVGRLCVSMLALVAEFERDVARERTKETMAWARRQGGGGGQPRFGFKHVKVEIDGQMKRRQQPDLEERKQMKEILRLRTEDPPWSWDEIRQEFNYVRKWYRTKKWGKNTKGREWTMPALMRACKAEIVLQHREAFSNREVNSE